MPKRAFLGEKYRDAETMTGYLKANRFGRMVRFDPNDGTEQALIYECFQLCKIGSADSRLEHGRHFR